MNKLFSLFASGAVAFVILMDIVTGQGPPALNGYVGMQPGISYQSQPAQIISRGPPVYPMPSRSDYLPPPQPELILKEQKDGAYGDEHKHEKEKSFDKSKEYEKENHKDKGMLSSLSNSVSKAWSNIGRR